MKIITTADVENIKAKYKELGDCAAVARALRISPATIKKYLNLPINENINIIKFVQPLPAFNILKFKDKDWSILCTLTANELNKLPQLWSEMEF